MHAHAHTHNRLMALCLGQNGCVSGTTWGEPVPEETFAHSPPWGRRRIRTDNKVSFEPVRVVRPNKASIQPKSAGWLAHNNSQCLNRLWISMPAVLVTVPTVIHNLLHPLSTSSITAHHLLDFMVQGNITEADAPHPNLQCCHIRHTPFLCQMPFLSQPSQFILAWDRHWTMLACIPSGLVTLKNIKSDQHQNQNLQY